MYVEIQVLVKQIKMRIYADWLVALLLLVRGNVAAQDFVTLDWKNPSPRYEGYERVVTELPGFAGAYYQEGTQLPYYIGRFPLGRDYAQADYRVTVEYPEYESLSRKEAKALAESGVCLPATPEVEVHCSVSAKEGTLVASFVPIVCQDGVYRRIRSFRLALTSVPRPARATARPDVEERYAAHSVLASGRWVKIKVTESGVYQLTHAELAKMGFSHPEKVRLYGYGGRLLSENLTKFKPDDLCEVPLWREADYMLFYGHGTVRWELSGKMFVHTQNYFSTAGYYFLTESEEAPMAFRQEETPDELGAVVVNTFPDYALYEKEEYAWMEGGRRLFEMYDYKNGNTRSYTFDGLTGITDDEGIVTVAFTADRATGTTTVTAKVDGTDLPGKLTVDRIGNYGHAALNEANLAWPGAKNAKTVVTLTHEREAGVSGRLDYIRLNFTRRLALYGAYTAFRTLTAGKKHFQIGQADGNTRVWRVDESNQVTQLAGKLEGDTYSTVCQAAQTDEFVVVNTKGKSFLKVENMGEVPNQDLHGLEGADMVIIVANNPDYLPHAERLARAHETYDSLQVAVVTADQVYNEFSSGTPDATAYRWLMKMLYDRAEAGREPKYLLLFGDATFDNRLLTTSWKTQDARNFLLCFESKESLSKTTSFMSDDYLGMLDDEDAAQVTRLYSYAVDLGVGRLPVRSAADAKEAVDRLLAYMDNKQPGSWKNAVAFLGDDGKNNDGNIHMEQSDAVAAVAQRCRPSLVVNKLYWDAFKMEKTATGSSYPEINTKVKKLFKEGLMLFNYTGHGDATALSDEYVITVRDLADMVTTRPPVWFTAACDIAPIDRLEVSLGEQAFLRGAAIGVMATARTVFPDPNCRMDSVFVRYLFSQPATATNKGRDVSRLGDVVRQTKAYISGLAGKAQTNDLHYVFVGDPALRYTLPNYDMVVDEFAAVETGTEEWPMVKAGGKVRVKGRVLTPDGRLAEDFEGKLYSKVFDSEEQITTHNNNGTAPTPFTYMDRTKTLFVGSDSVQAGRFDFVFPVPLDINYADSPGLLNLYAMNADGQMESHGSFGDFYVGGTEEGAMTTDSVGPKITMYLNTPDFVSGAKVNATPYLVVELEDEDGINTSGSGIGHDLVAVIDNSTRYTYVLNSYYEPVFGDYTRGSIRFAFPSLPDGQHRLLFRAWDMKNNSSTAYLDFEVVDGLPVGLSITCTKSPAHDQTMFVLSHDRPNARMDVEITVYDNAGRPLWTHRETGEAEGNYYYVDWDLRTNSGQRLMPGLYLYRASIRTEDSRESTETQKIVIAGQ